MAQYIDLDTSKVFIAGAILTVPILCRILVSYVRNKAIDNNTATYDLNNLGNARVRGRIKGTAVICGGSMAGLWAARVCADHFEDVLIIDPEEWLSTEDGRSYYLDDEGNSVEHVKRHARTRVMQFDQPHSYRPFFLDALRKLHPNADTLLKKCGVRIVPAWNSSWLNGHLVSGYFPHHYPKDSYPLQAYADRESMESGVRRVVHESAGDIRWLIGTVTGIVLSKDKEDAVEFVSVRTTDGMKNIASSFVVDCTGRAHTGIKWLERLDKFASASLKDNIDVYTMPGNTFAVRYAVPPEMRKRLPIPGGFENAGSIYAYVLRPPHETRGVVANANDSCRIQIACVTTTKHDDPNGDGLPTVNTLIEWIQGLKGGETPVAPWFLEMIKILQENEPDSIASKQRIPPNSWAHYEKIKDVPSNFIATGDAVMCLNPRFGQGVTKTCIDGVTLDRMLRSIPESENPIIPKNFSQKFFQLQTKRIADMWSGTKVQDYKVPGTVPCKGESVKQSGIGVALPRLLLQLAIEGDEQVAFTTWKVSRYLAPNLDILHPMILLKLLWLSIRLMLGISKPLLD